MKWDNTQQWIDYSQELLMIALSYFGNNSYDDGTQLKKVGVGPLLDFEADRQKAYELSSAMNPKLIADELEAFMDCDTKHDKKVFDVWLSKFVDGTSMLYLFNNVLKSGWKTPNTWIKLGGWERYITQTKDQHELVWLIAVILQHKFSTLQNEVNFILDSYGMEDVKDKLLSIWNGDTSEQKQEKIDPMPQSAKSTKSIYDIIQCEDKEGLVKRLHTLIDGKRGKDIAVVFILAKTEGLITRFPTKMMLTSEFNIRGSWTAIAKYMNEDALNDDKILGDAAAIKFN